MPNGSNVCLYVVYLSPFALSADGCEDGIMTSSAYLQTLTRSHLSLCLHSQLKVCSHAPNTDPLSPKKVVQRYSFFFFFLQNISESKWQLSVTAQQSSNSDTVDGMSCSAFAQETETQRTRSVDEQLPHSKLVQPNFDRCADDGGAMCSKQKQLKTTIMHSSEKIDDKVDQMMVAACNTDGDGRNKNEQKLNKSTTNRSRNKNCDNFNENASNGRRYGDASAASASSGGGGGISSDSGVGFDLGLDDDDTDEDPYAELEFYLEKVKVSVEIEIFLFVECICPSRVRPAAVTAPDDCAFAYFLVGNIQYCCVSKFVHCVQSLDND